MTEAQRSSVAQGLTATTATRLSELCGDMDAFGIHRWALESINGVTRIRIEKLGQICLSKWCYVRKAG